MPNFFNNQGEQGIEGVAGAVGSAVQKTIKTSSDHADKATADFVNQLYAPTDTSAGQSEDQGIEGMGQAKPKNLAAKKARVSYRNPILSQLGFDKIFGTRDANEPEVLRVKHDEELAAKGYTPEEIQKLDQLRQTLHDQYYKDLTSPKKQPEESVAEQNAREEEEKKKNKQVKQYEEHKKEEALAVTMKKTGIENKGFGAG